MAGTVKGITVEIGGDTNGLTKALSKVKREIDSTQKELKDVDKLLKFDPKNTELLAQKQQLLAKQTDTVKDKLEGLKKAKKQCDDEMKNGTEINQNQYRKLQREIAQTEQDLKSLAKQAAQGGIDKVTNGAKNLAKGAAVTATAVIGIGTAAYATANKIADAGDEIDKHSQKLGISAEAYQRWDQVCQHSGTSIDSLKKGMQTLETKIADNDIGFQKLGISIKGASKEDVFKQTILSLQKIEDPIKRNQMAIELFGSKATLEMGALLNCTEQETQAMLDNANVMSNENVKAAAQFKDMQQDLNNTLSTLGSEILAELMPLITSIMDKLKEFIQSHKEQIQGFCDKIKEFGKWCIDNMGLIEGLITGIGTAFIAWNVVSMIQGLVSAIKAFKMANEGATIAQAALNLVMKANWIGIVITGIMALVAAFVVLWNKSEAFRNFWIGLWDNIKNIVMTAVNFVKDNWKQIILFITNPIAGAIALLYKFNPKFKEWVDKLIKGVKEKFAKMKEIGKYILEGLWNGINDKVEWLKGKVKGVVDKIKSWFTGKEGFDEHSPSKWAKQVGEFLMQGLANGVTEDMSAEQALQKKLDNIKNFINENINSIRNDIKQKQSGFADTLKSGTLFDTNTFVFGDTTQTGIKLHDFTKDTQANINWANLLTQLEERLYSVSDDSTLNSTFMQLVRDMGITDGTSFIDAAMKVNDEQFKEYIDGWQTYQKSAEIAAAQTYSREANQLQSDFLGEVANGLTNVVDNFKAGGADSANAFGNGFMEKIKGVMVQIQEQLQSYTNEFTLTGSALRGLGSSTTNNTSYDNRSTNVTINNSGGNPSAYEQRQQINRVFNQLQLQGVL